MNKRTSKRREREKEARRQAILDAAERVFSAQGYYGATLDEIAGEAELAKGTLYNYYRDKQDLFISLMRRGHNQFFEVLKKTVDDCSSLEEFISHLLIAMVHGMEKHKYMFRFFVDAGRHLTPELQAEILSDMQRWFWEAPKQISEVMLEISDGREISAKDRLNGSRLILVSARVIFMNRFLAENEEKASDIDIEDFAGMIYRALTAESKE